MDKERIQYLLEARAEMRLTEAEKAELEALLGDETAQDQLLDVAYKMMQVESARMIVTDPALAQTTFEKIMEADRGVVEQGRTVTMRRSWWAAAAIFILMAGAATFYLLVKPGAETQNISARTKDIAPGKAGAILHLADGKEIVLEEQSNGVLAPGVIKQDSSLDYSKQTAAVEMHTLTTPKGRTFMVELADGTKAWLNAGSSITYPTQFSGKERKVIMTGEVYFAVKHNAQMPFRVSVSGETVEDMGTEFNINAYGDETAIRTTLIEGKVKVRSVALEPGQQAVIGNAGGHTLTINKDVDTEGVTAWKNGRFYFMSADIETVMKQLSRWYDLEVVFEGERTKEKYSGGLTRTASLQQCLEALDISKVHYRLEGNKLTVLP